MNAIYEKFMKDSSDEFIRTGIRPDMDRMTYICQTDQSLVWVGFGHLTPLEVRAKCREIGFTGTAFIECVHRQMIDSEDGVAKILDDPEGQAHAFEMEV
jgi:hypothetical protein